MPFMYNAHTGMAVNKSHVQAIDSSATAHAPVYITITDFSDQCKLEIKVNCTGPAYIFKLE